jgi:hypothetical protein
MVGVGVIGFLAALGQCSSKPSPADNSTEMSSAQVASNLTNAVAAQGPSPVEPLSRVHIKEGVRDYRLVYAAESLPGAMIFSQNCYDALSRSFSWAKLDTCGGFDAAMAANISDADAAAYEKEATFFGPETAAQRYLAAATGAGEDTSAADERWSNLQSRVPHPIAPSLQTYEPAADQEIANAETAAAGNQVVNETQ